MGNNCLLDAELMILLKHLPTNESAAGVRHDIEGVQEFLERLPNTGEVNRVDADVFGQDFDVAYPEAIISDLSPGG